MTTSRTKDIPVSSMSNPDKSIIVQSGLLMLLVNVAKSLLEYLVPVG